MSQSRALEVIAGSIDPANRLTAPPLFMSLGAFSKAVTGMANVSIDDSNLQGEKVPTSTGLVLDFVVRDVATIFRAGIVPPGAITPTSNVITIPSLNFAASGITGTELTAIRMTFTKPTPLPYYDDGINQLKFSPDLSESFSMTRKYSGIVNVMSDTIPIGNTALNGFMSAASIADTRDVAQVEDSAFDVNTMIQCSVTAKDGIKQIPVKSGIVSLVGPDIPLEVSVPVKDLSTASAGAASSYIIGSVSGSWIPQGGGYQRLTLWQAFLSPWNVECSGGAGSTSPDLLPGIQNVKLDPINICGEMDHRVIFNYSTPATLGLTYPCMYVFATDVFASVNGDGSLRYYTRSCSREIPVIAKSTVALVFNNNAVQVDLKMSAQADIPFTQRGMYIGTYIRHFVVTQDAGTTSVAAPVSLTNVRIDSMPNNMYTPGELGPVRIIRWDGLSKGQVIRINASLNVQCVAQGSIAPFTQTASMYSDVGLNLNIFPLLQELYNGPGEIRRIWNGDNYKDMLSRLSSFATPEEFAQAHAKLQGAAQAAGVFESLGGALGGLFGSTGRNIGSAIGSVGDFVPQFAGRLVGAGSAAGMYGVGAGSAAGMYGRSHDNTGMAAGIYADDEDEDSVAQSAGMYGGGNRKRLR